MAFQGDILRFVQIYGRRFGSRSMVFRNYSSDVNSRKEWVQKQDKQIICGYYPKAKFTEKETPNSSDPTSLID